MIRVKTAFVLLVVFFAGCAASRILAVPPARAGTTLPRWEYACRNESGDDDVSKMASAMGQQGWEMVAASSLVHAGTSDSITWCFKRPLP
jgi:hypothetical protein